MRRSCLVAMGLGPTTWLLGCFSAVPELSRSEAAALISQSPQFSEAHLLVSVDGIARGPQSQQKFTLAAFTLQNKSAKNRNIPATAQFNYWRGQWRLDSFAYGTFPDRVGVQIDR